MKTLTIQEILNILSDVQVMVDNEEEKDQAVKTAGDMTLNADQLAQWAQAAGTRTLDLVREALKEKT